MIIYIIKNEQKVSLSLFSLSSFCVLNFHFEFF